MKKFYYGWRIVAVTNLICMIGYGTWLYSFGVFFKPMMAELGWTRAMTAAAFSLRSIEGGIASPIVGWGVDRYGARIVMTIGAFIAGFGFAAMYFVNSLISFYIIYGIILSIGMSALLYLPSNAVVAKWFDKRLSLALSLVSIGAGFGGLILAPGSAMLIERIGWRYSFLVLGIVFWVVVLPLTRLIRNSPAEMGLEVDGKEKVEEISADDESESLSEEPEVPAESADYTLKEAFKTHTFWILTLAFFFRGMTHSTVVVHSIPALTDYGITPAKAAFSLGLMTFVSIGGRLFAGFAGDRYDKRYLLMIAFILQSMGIFILMKAQTMPMVYLFILVYALGFGATVPLSPAIRAEYFGRASFGKIQGFMTPMIMVSSAIGPILVGYMFDRSGSYDMAFMMVGIFTLFSALTILAARPVKRSVRAAS